MFKTGPCPVHGPALALSLVRQVEALCHKANDAICRQETATLAAECSRRLSQGLKNDSAFEKFELLYKY
jgi:hypothetical protein